MRRVLVVLICLVCLVLPLPLFLAASGNADMSRPSGSYLASPMTPWAEIGVLTTAVTLPGVDERDCATVDANTAILVWKIPENASGGWIKFSTTADADSHTVSVLAAPGWQSGKQLNRYGQAVTDDYLFGGELTLTGGTQVARNSDVYVDTISVTDANGVLDFTVFDSGHDRVCVMLFDFRGCHRVAFVGTAIESSASLIISGRWW